MKLANPTNPTNPTTTTTSTPEDDRLKLHEAIGVTALVAFAAFGLTFWVSVLVTRCYIVDAIDHFKRKGDNHVH